ncbi:Developmental and secondary metabolism regulator VeA-like protein [Penicillium ucsense]|uniref:Developmental and secondary metabolism regulator veA n=1 Tax=Penicillium ucsense TaxID=2839758 RepID=A0A8J8W1D5_9EURO|nr:Developmental and secondary metabolism regulator VeA-like protein [Penicillium ucsense]KAF7731372.1 Developmental and secondary metabolism regulator VeA-like protein [Penicillium ucsense]
MASRPNPMTSKNETTQSVSRITREGKKLTYTLSVMQQPERARACGAGAKSSADRRPVDPPPVVELRIFESDPVNDAQKTDITFAYNANFFLYATLDSVRHMAAMRGSAAPSASVPVLTGVPVAGVAYLDRPSQAGYFIFPDLSVRHEGRFRLSFHLYEEIKDVKDADQDATAPLPNQAPRSASGQPVSPQSYLHFRLEVQSLPFTVYSAKKFPGLATSTSLSRIIAEQGCRVRIRRDVRMRRRGDKREEEYEYDEGSTAVYPRNDRYASPDRYVAQTVERPRSNSNGSVVESPYGYGGEVKRRPSGSEYGFQCPPQPYHRPMPPAPMPHTQTSGYQSHLTFGSTPSQYPAPHMPPTPPPVAPSANYSPRSVYANIRHQSVATDYDGTPAAYPMANPGPEPNGYPKNTTTLYRVEPPKMQQPYLMPEVPQYPPASQSMASTISTPTLGHSSYPAPSYKQMPAEYVNLDSAIEVGSPGQGYDSVSGKRMLYHSGSLGAKRTHEDSFGIDERPMQNGMRPDMDPYPAAYRDFSAESRAALMAELGPDMAYKRANGRMVMKAPPTVQ